MNTIEIRLTGEQVRYAPVGDWLGGMFAAKYEFDYTIKCVEDGVRVLVTFY
jgi:hypothetical protein